MKDLIALCSSVKCVGHEAAHRTAFVKKDVPKYKTECPDCRSILLWKKPGRNMNVASKRRPTIISDHKRDFSL